ncbi:MAG: hypothetical protein A2Z83_09080 [Omnitrophica bacterium GWA2_52_8]|nr:MAG: hypothetical protein A2Z83_09080 [Omnitrophica bacterium GWA2_52_8]
MSERKFSMIDGGGLMRAIILAAGFGTRLYPLTKYLPKALLPLGNKTMLDYLIEPLEKLPMVKEITIMTNSRFYLDFYTWRKNSKYTKPIYIEEDGVNIPEKRCGAIKDLQLAIESREKADEDYLILCSDNFFDFPLSHFLLPVLSHPHYGFVGLYDVKDTLEATKYGVVQINHEHRIIDFEEKPTSPKSTLVSVGVYYLPGALKHRLDEYLAQGRPADKIGDFIGSLSRDEHVYGVEFEGAWFDIGSIVSYEKARKYLNAPAD